jgi:hypothetical protein
MEFFTLLLYAKVSGLELLLGVNCFAFFSTDSNSTWNFVFYDTHIKFFQKDVDEKAKKTKNVF